MVWGKRGVGRQGRQGEDTSVRGWRSKERVRGQGRQGDKQNNS
nr:hypothetical protein [Hassalia byssoidea]